MINARRILKLIRDMEKNDTSGKVKATKLPWVNFWKNEHIFRIMVKTKNPVELVLYPLKVVNCFSPCLNCLFSSVSLYNIPSLSLKKPNNYSGVWFLFHSFSQCLLNVCLCDR